MPDKRFTQEEGTQVYTGTELLFKGGLESGVALMTGYPGSPVADFFNVAQANAKILKEHGIAFQMANNEALSAARLNGSQMADLRAMTVIKSVGAHVAADGLSLGNLAKRRGKGGAVVVIGDDPWSDSTQVPTDSRYISKHLHMPVMEPASFQEMKDWLDVAFGLSNRSGLFVAYLVTTNLADGGGTVEARPNRYPDVNTRNPFVIETAKIPVEETVVLTPRTAEQEQTLAERYRILLEAARGKVNQILHQGKKRRQIGFISSGLACRYLEHALYELGLSEKFPILKLGITFPVDPEILLEFARGVDAIYVVEEKRDFLEDQVAVLLKDAYQKGVLDRFIPVWGKTFPKNLKGFPKTRGLHPSLVMEILGPVLKQVTDIPVPTARIDEELTLIEQTGAHQIELPERSPTFCPGCPHRDSAAVLLSVKKDFMDPQYMRKRHAKDQVDLVFHGDTGCYTMLMYEPNKELMHNYSGMGLGGGTGAGIDPFITNKQVVFMGDSTFFHSGMIAISDAVKHGQDITFIILENGTTAMTGHQPTPASTCDIAGEATIAQSIEEVIHGMIRGTEITVQRTNPAYRESYRSLLEETILQDGVKVIIADKECGITYHRRKAQEESQVIQEKGYLPVKTSVNITPEVCEFCLECTRTTGCPGLTFVNTPYGTKIQTDLTWCVSDGSCTKGKVCPSFEEVIVVRNCPPRENGNGALKEIPEAKPRPFEESWNVYIAGVGGMGIGVITAILVRAGHKEGYQVHFADKKGLAIRNGGVYSQVTYVKDGASISPIIPYGKADLMMAIDILEGVRGIDPRMNMRIAHPNRTAAIANTHKTPTIRTLIGEDDFDISTLEENIRKYTRRGAYFGADLSEISQRLLGDKLYANLIMLGIAYQRGELPLRLEALEWAITESVKRDRVQENLRAFRIGRDAVLHPESYTAVDETMESARATIAQKTMLLSRNGGQRLAAAYQNLVQELIDYFRMDDATHQALAIRIYDLIRYENLNYARRYAELVKGIYDRDRVVHEFAATKAVMTYLHKVMLIKDEIYVSYLLTSEEKLARDRLRYQIDPQNGDRVIYRHFNRPEFTLFGKDIHFDITTRNWMLRLMKRMKFLRRFLPQWHRREKAFRDWYLQLVERFQYFDDETYFAYVEALKCPEGVKGYREIRYPKMEEAKRLAASLLHPRRTVRLVAQNAPRF